MTSNRYNNYRFRPSLETLEDRVVPAVPDAGLFASAAQTSLSFSPTIAKPVHVNDDLYIDLAVAGDDEIHILHGTPSGSFSTPVSYPTGGSGTWGVSPGDLNGDGWEDLVFSDPGGGRLGMLTNVGGRFELNSISLPIHQPTDVEIADLDNDGNLDAVATSQGGQYITVLYGDGKGNLGAGQTYSTGVGPRTLTIEDINGDGLKDILVAISAGGGAGSVAVFINEGASFAQGVEYAVQRDPQNVGVGDLDGDNIPDLVAANGGSQTISILFGNGNGTFQDAVHHAAHSPNGLTVHDMDGDSSSDIIFTNYNEGTVEVWFGGEAGSFRDKTKYGVGNGSFAVTLSDANKDGYADIFVTNYGGKSVSVIMSQNRPEKIIAPEPVEEIEAEVTVTAETSPTIQTQEFVPAYSISTEGNMIVVRYANMPDGLVIDAVNAGVRDARTGEVFGNHIPAGDGVVIVPVVESHAEKHMELVIRDTRDNSRVGPYIPFSFHNRTITRAPESTTVTLRELTWTGQATQSGVALLAERLVQGEDIPVPMLHYTTNGDQITLHYQNMPEGFALESTSSGRVEEGAHKRMPIPAGTGEVAFYGGVYWGDLDLVVVDQQTKERFGPRVGIGVSAFTLTRKPTTETFELREIIEAAQQSILTSSYTQSDQTTTDAFFAEEAASADVIVNQFENAPVTNDEQLSELQRLAALLTDLNNSPILPLATRMSWLIDSVAVSSAPSKLFASEFNGQSAFVYADGAAVHFTNAVTGRHISSLYPHGLNEIRDAAISADSTRLATISGSQLAVTNSNDSSNILTVQLPSVATTVNWLGDDVLVGTQSQGAFRVNPDGGETLMLPDSTAIQFSADGSIIGVSEERFLTFYDAASLTQLKKIDLGYNESSDRWEPYTDHRWAYDAESGYIAYTATARNGYPQTVRTLSLTDGTDLGGIVELHAHSLGFAPGGNRLAMVVFNDVLLFERAERGWNQSGKYTYDHPSELAFSADGSVLFISDRNGIDAQTVPSTVGEVSNDEIQRQQELVEFVVSHAENALDTAGPVSTSDTAEFVDSLRLRQASLVVAQNVVSLVTSNRLIPELRDSVETVWGKINLRLRELETDINRLESFGSLYIQNEANALDENRLLRETTQAIDLWNLDGQYETYGHVASNEMVRIVSAGNSTPPSQSQQTAIDRSLNLPSMLTGIDVSSASNVVAAVRFRLSVAGESPQIVAYRDGVSIGTFQPDEHGVVDVRSEEGITEILIHRPSNATVILRSLTLTTDPTQKARERLPLSPATNRELALAVAPTDWNTVYVPAYPRIIFVDPNQYTLVEVHGYSKSPSINSVEYFPSSGGGNPHTLPDNFITKLSSNRWILHPGVPGQLQVNVEGASIRYLGSNLGYEWEYEQRTTVASTIQELMPNGPMQIAINTLDVYAADGAGDFVHEFVDTRPSQVTQKSHPVGTGAVVFLAVIENTGGEGGTATIEFFGAGSTYSNDELGTPQHSFTVNLDAGGSRILKSWVDVPSGAQTGTAVMRVTYPDGRVEVSPFIGTAFPKEMAFAIVTDPDSPTTDVDQLIENETDNIVAQPETIYFGQRLSATEKWYQMYVLADLLVNSRDTTNYHSTTESSGGALTHLSSSSDASAPSAQSPQMFQFLYPPVQGENMDSQQINEFSFAAIMERNLLVVDPALNFLTNITDTPADEAVKSAATLNELASLNQFFDTSSKALGVIGAAVTLTNDIDSPINWLDAGFQLGVAFAQRGGGQFTLLDLIIRSNPAFQQLLGPQFMPSGTAVEG